jgi:hypothetical protein
MAACFVSTSTSPSTYVRVGLAFLFKILSKLNTRLHVLLFIREHVKISMPYSTMHQFVCRKSITHFVIAMDGC